MAHDLTAKPLTLWRIMRKSSRTQAPARRRICHESRNSPGISYDYGRHDRWYGVSDPFHLGQGWRQAEPRYRFQVAPGLDRRRTADARPWRSRFPVPEEVLGLPQEGLRPQSLKGLSRISERPCSRRGVFAVLRAQGRSNPG